MGWKVRVKRCVGVRLVLCGHCIVIANCSPPTSVKQHPNPLLTLAIIHTLTMLKALRVNPRVEIIKTELQAHVCLIKWLSDGGGVATAWINKDYVTGALMSFSSKQLLLPFFYLIKVLRLQQTDVDTVATSRPQECDMWRLDFDFSRHHAGLHEANEKHPCHLPFDWFSPSFFCLLCRITSLFCFVAIPCKATCNWLWQAADVGQALPTHQLEILNPELKKLHSRHNLLLIQYFRPYKLYVCGVKQDVQWK